MAGVLCLLLELVVSKLFIDMKGFKIPGVSFSLSRALGIDKIKRQIARDTGIPTTKSGLEKKIGRAVIDKLFCKR